MGGQNKAMTQDVELTDRPLEEVWIEYQKTHSKEIRNFLLVKYLPLVKFTADRIRTKLPDEVDVEDLKQGGVFGLLDAIDSFDLERKVKFETFCGPRIRGAILDGLRGMDWVPRLVRSRTAKVEGARRKFEMKHGRPPTPQELATKLDVSLEEFDRIRKDAGPKGVVSLNRKWFDSDSNKDMHEIDVVRDDRQADPLTTVQRRDLRDLVTKGLTRAERLIVILYYYEEMTMKEIGATLDLSESRVSQMHTGILGRLKAQLRHRGEEFERDKE